MRKPRAAKRLRAAELRSLALAEAARRQEAKDEAIVPAIQRHAVTDAAGVVIRAARIRRDGAAFVRADPLAHLSDMAEKGGMLTGQHVAAAKRLLDCWDRVGEGVGLGASDWASLRGPRGTAPSTPAGHTSLLAQVAQRLELDVAMTWLGALWPCVADIVLHGMSLSAWAAKVGLDRRVAPGYLLAALVRLVEFHARCDAAPDGKAKFAVAVPMAESH